MYGLEAWLDTGRTPDPTERVVNARRSLGQALDRLSELAPLEVRNLAICTKVDSFGCIEEFAKDHQFKPGQRMVLYAEIENLTWESTSRGFHSSLRATYTIVDSRRHQVVEHRFDVVEEICQRHRRDFFFCSMMSLPQNMQPGKHILQLTIEDCNGAKFGQSTVELTVQAVGG